MFLIKGCFMIFLVYAADPNCPALKGLDDQSVMLFVGEESTKLGNDYFAKNQDEFNEFAQKYFADHSGEFAAFQQNLTGGDATTFTQTYIAGHPEEFAAFQQNLTGGNVTTFTQTYIVEHPVEFVNFNASYQTQHDNFVNNYLANNSEATQSEAEQAFNDSIAPAFIKQVIATAYITSVIVTSFIREVIGNAFVAKVVTPAITPILQEEIKEYVQGKVEHCLVTKGCGAFIIQGSVPNSPVPTFNGTTCTKCTSVTTEEGCKNATTSTCKWSGGKCKQVNCPSLMSYQFDLWTESGMSKEKYLEVNHAKENEEFTRKLCKNYGCMYMNSFYWCSAWAKWALIVTLVVSILFIIAAVGIIVVVCFVCKKNDKSLGKTESTAELQQEGAAK